MSTMTPFFGILITLISFSIGKYLFKKTNGFFLFAPLFVGMVLGIVFLKTTGFSYEDYNQGGKMISFFLDPATACFAIPLYKRRDVLKKYFVQIMSGITFGTVAAVVGIYFVATTFSLGPQIIASMLPQAATTAIAMPVSTSIGGVAEITSLACILNAVIIYALGSKMLKLCHISEPIAKGLALGTSGHSLGAAVANEMGSVEASMASIALVVVGVIVVVVVPIVSTFIL